MTVLNTRNRIAEPAKLQTVFSTTACVTFSAFFKGYRLWRWIRIGNVYSDPKNSTSLICGHGLNLLVGNLKMVKITSICVLFSTRIIQCLEELDNLKNYWNSLKICFRWKAKVIQVDPKNNNMSDISALILALVHRIQVVSIHIFKFTKQLLVFSFCLVDVAESLSLEPRNSDEGINQLFVNATTCLDRISKNKESIEKRIDSNRKNIEKILDIVGVGGVADPLISATKTTLNCLEGFNSIKCKTSAVIQECKEALVEEFSYRDKGLPKRLRPDHLAFP
jgi:hypothetical protein